MNLTEKCTKENPHGTGWKVKEAHPYVSTNFPQFTWSVLLVSLEDYWAIYLCDKGTRHYCLGAN